MNLYLIRHADAAEAIDETEKSDFARPLTDKGRIQSRALGTALYQMGIQFDAIVSSPLLRAMHTSEELLGQHPEPLPPLHIFDEIGFEVRPRKIVKFLRELGVESIAIVGHQPGLCRFLAWLIGSKKAQLDLAKAGCAKVICKEPGKGDAILEWLITPEWYA